MRAALLALLALLVVGGACRSGPPPRPAAPEEAAPTGRLPAGTTPLGYDLALEIDPDQARFSGTVTIRFDKTPPVSAPWP